MQARLTAKVTRLRVVSLTAKNDRAEVLRLRAEARHAARAAGLTYVDDSRPGLRRQRKGTGFAYQDANGRAIRDTATLRRIRALAIPPAWRDVWICPSAQGHIQATGRDARGRKQYRYHLQWSAARSAEKHRRICEFARLLPKLRAHVSTRLRKPGLGRETVLAALLRMVDLTAIRVGNEEYSRANDSYGLTTLRVRHVRVRGQNVELNYRGKSGVKRKVVVRDARLAKLIAACRELRGKQLFQFIDETGAVRPIHAGDLNAYLQSLTAAKFSVKDFRTWSATVRAARELRVLGVGGSQRATKKLVLEAVRRTAEHLGNTPSVCRNSYIHPGLIEAYAAGESLPPEPPHGAPAAAKHELAVLAFLERVVVSKARRPAALAHAG